MVFVYSGIVARLVHVLLLPQRGIDVGEDQLGGGALGRVIPCRCLVLSFFPRFVALLDVLWPPCRRKKRSGWLSTCKHGRVSTEGPFSLHLGPCRVALG